MNKLSALLFVCCLLYCKYSDNKNKYVKYGVGILSLYFLYKSFPSIDTLPADVSRTTCTSANNCTLKDRPGGSAENYCSTDLMASEQLSPTLGLAGADDGTICNHDDQARSNNLTAGQKCYLKCADPNKKIFTKDGKIASEQNPVATCVAMDNAAEPKMAVDDGLADGCRKAREGDECATNDDCDEDENNLPMNCNNKKCAKQNPSDDNMGNRELTNEQKFIICKVTGNQIDDVTKWNSNCGNTLNTALAAGGVCCNSEPDETPLGGTGMGMYTGIVLFLFFILVAICKWLGDVPLWPEMGLFIFPIIITAAICVYNFYRFYNYSNKYKAV